MDRNQQRAAETTAPSLAHLSEAIAAFERDNPELVDALSVFAISSVEYEKAIRALHHAPTVTSSSSQPS